MANISTKLVGGFVPLIVYNNVSNYKLELALLTLFLEYFLSLIFGFVLKKYLIKKPQVFLFLRIIPIIIYEVLLLFVADMPILCVLGIGLAYSLSYAFKYIPTEVLFAYINATKKVGTGKQLALSKMLEQLSIIFGVIIGGVFLDNLDMRIMIVVSIAIYAIGAIPQLIFYITNKKKRTINQEYASYAHIALKETAVDKEFANNVSKKVRIKYAIFYFLQESWQSIYNLIPLFAFILTGSYTTSAIATAIFDGVYGVGCLLAGKFNNKKDLTIPSAIMGVIVGVMPILMIFIKAEHVWVLYILCAIMAFSYSFAYFFMYDRMLKKSKLIGRNTTCIINKIYMFMLSTCTVVAFGVISLPVAFCVGGGLSIVSGMAIPYVEESTRRMLVDHLEDNEIREKSKIYYFKKKRKKKNSKSN